jgi:hypothetical protein
MGILPSASRPPLAASFSFSRAAFGGLLFFQPGRLWRPLFLASGRTRIGERSGIPHLTPTHSAPKGGEGVEGWRFCPLRPSGGEGGDTARSAGEGEVGPIGSAAAPPRSRHRRYRSRCRRPVLARPSDAAPWRRCRAPDNCGRTPADCRGRPAPAAAGDRCSAGCGLREIPEREAVVHLPYSGKPTNRPFVPCPVFQKVRLS